MIFEHRPGALVVWAPAKLNLFLEVLGKRSDGYHQIESLMVTVNSYDTLLIKEALTEEVSLRCEDAGATGRPRPQTANAESPNDESESGGLPFVREVPPLPEGKDNLVWKAVELLRQHTGVRQGVDLVLRKRIPLAAGLGGGSSDAAAALLGLNRLWKLGLSLDELCHLAAQLGSDVPFFLYAPVAVCRGRGEQVEQQRLPLGLHFVLSCPPEGLSTAAVYRRAQPGHPPRSVGPLVDELRQGRLEAAGRYLFNRLQSAVEEHSAVIRRQRRDFSRLPLPAHQMSGSGPSYFGLCRTRRQARRLAGGLRAQGHRCFVVRSSP